MPLNDSSSGFLVWLAEWVVASCFSVACGYHASVNVGVNVPHVLDFHTTIKTLCLLKY